MSDVDKSAALAKLAAKWQQAKEQEQKANALRVEIEDKIVQLAGKRDEGAQTIEVPGFKITTTGKVSRTMDWEKWAEIASQFPQELRPVKLKPELDATGVKWLQTHRTDLYKLLPITVKPAKTAVEIKPAKA